MNFYRQLLLFFALAGQAWASIPQVCGSGADEPAITGGSPTYTKGSCPAGWVDARIGLGCDKLCTDYDTLGNGDVVGSCDPTNRDVYTGAKVQVSGVDYKVCLSNGSFGSTVTGPAAEGTALGAHDYYIDCGNSLGNASDSNNGTSYNTPFLTLGMISGGSAGSKPSGAVTLVGDDHVYLIGTGTCTTQFTVGSRQVMADLSSSGSNGHEIVIEVYPGATPKLAPNGGIAFFGTSTSSHYKFKGNPGSLLDCSTGTGVNGLCVRWLGTQPNSNFEFERLYFHDSILDGSNNFAAIEFEKSNKVVVHNSYFQDNKFGSGNIDNCSNITWLDDPSNVNQGKDHRAHHNLVAYTSYNSTQNCTAFFKKHNTLAADAGDNGHLIDHNITLNARVPVVWNGSALRMQYNLLAVDSASTGYRSVWTFDGGSSLPREDVRIQYNLFLYTGNFQHRAFAYTGANKVLFDHNTILDNRAGFGADEGLQTIDSYATSVNAGIGIANNYIVSDNNCYYDAAAAIKLGWYSQSGHANTGQYTLPNWRTNTGQDINSLETDPLLSSDGMFAPSGSCGQYYWRADILAPTPTPTATPTPTPTPTASPTPTPTATPVPVAQLPIIVPARQ